MSSNEYWMEKTVSWKGVTAGYAISIIAVAALLLAETVNYVAAAIGKTDVGGRNASIRSLRSCRQLEVTITVALAPIAGIANLLRGESKFLEASNATIFGSLLLANNCMKCGSS